MPSSLRSRVKTEESDTCAELHVHTSTPLLDVWPRPITNDPAGLFLFSLQDKCILQLSRIGSCAIDALAMHCLGCISRKRRHRRRDVMLKEAVVFERNPTDASEDGTLHEVVGVGAKTINDVYSQRVSTLLQSLKPRISPWSSHMLICGICALALAKGS